MKDFLDEWVAGILANRADQTWTPHLFAPADIAAYLGTLAGIEVQVDDNLPERALVLRCADDERDPPIPPMSIVDNGERARYDGIIVPAT